MIVLTIAESSIEKIGVVSQQADLVDILELRLDYLECLDFEQLISLCSKMKKPVLFTLRRKKDGGKFQGTENQRQILLQKLADLHPDYMDVEHDLPSSLISRISEKTQVVGSYHNFEITPDLYNVFSEMQNKDFDYYKIAVKAKSTLDMMRLLCFLKEQAPIENLTCISMGKLGQPSRVLGSVYGSCMTYTYLKDSLVSTAQLSLSELIDIYRANTTNANTDVYALIGNPVEQSIGHIWHNRSFVKEQINAVYLKMSLEKEEISSFIQYALHLGFKGLSVTMPFKKDIVSYVNTNLSSCNTLVLKNGRYYGYNTDVKSILGAIESRITLENKTVVIVGAGGVARSLIEPLLDKRAIVYLWSRKGYSFKGVNKLQTLEELQRLSYDVLIQTTSVGMLPNEDVSLVDDSMISKGSIILEMIYSPRQTKLLKIAAGKQCICISGLEVFERQAGLQQQLWLNRLMVQR